MICVVLRACSSEILLSKISQAVCKADLIEFRFDTLLEWDEILLEKIKCATAVPMIWTLRSAQAGGSYRHSEAERIRDLLRLARLQPHYLDIESHVPQPVIEQIAQAAPQTSLIISHHDYSGMPNDLDELLAKLKRVKARFYKIAVTPQNTVQTLRLLYWARSKCDVIAIGMGPYGQCSRIMAPILSQPFTYAALLGEERDGQLAASTLIDQYHYKRLTPQTAVYALLGDPVEQSISDQTHNKFFQNNGIDAVYLKLSVTNQELSDCLSIARGLPFAGFSITMPLKETIIAHLDGLTPLAQVIQAVNTVFRQEELWIGDNTDATGIQEVMAPFLTKGKYRVIVLGAGGVSKAIVYIARTNGAEVVVLNRTLERAQRLAGLLGVQWGGLEEMTAWSQRGYDLLVQCLPCEPPISADHLLPEAVIMDVRTSPRETPLLKQAESRGCRIIAGYHLFASQAMGQFQRWFNASFEKTDLAHLKEIVYDTLLRSEGSKNRGGDACLLND